MDGPFLLSGSGGCVKEVLKQLVQMEQEADDFGFCWPSKKSIVEDVIGEAREVLEVLEENKSRAHLEEEVGDMIYSALAVAVNFEIDPKEVLQKAINKFTIRFKSVRKLARERGLEDLKDQDVSELVSIWKEAKIKTKKDVDKLLGL